MPARFAVFVLLLAAPHLALAQAAWSLVNASNQTLNFETLDPSRGTWRQQSIYPNQPVNYTMSPGQTAGKFRIATQNRGYVEYAVKAGGQYRIVWDQQKGVWDLRAAQAAAPAALVGPAWELQNTTNQTLSFETLDPARGTWMKQTSYPNQSMSYRFASGSTGKIRIATQGRGFVEYDVRAGWKYNLVWDQAKGVWDLRTLRRGA